MRGVLLAFGLLLQPPSPVLAQADRIEAPPAPDRAPPSVDEPLKPSVAAKEKPADPRADREFKPSEEVSPDQEVDFPADL